MVLNIGIRFSPSLLPPLLFPLPPKVWGSGVSREAVGKGIPASYEFHVKTCVINTSEGEGAGVAHSFG